jgi:hypothetical protein
LGSQVSSETFLMTYNNFAWPSHHFWLVFE